MLPKLNKEEILDFYHKSAIIGKLMYMQSLTDQLWNKKLVFFATFFIVFTVSYLVLVAIDFVPEPVTVTENEPELDAETEIEVPETLPGASAQETTVEESTLPLSLYIERLDRTIKVLNPESRTIADLDAALLDGVVRHPDSAALNQQGNVFILGHSSYLPNVINRNFQAFNGIQQLEWGDLIELTDGTKQFVYRVEKVYQAKAQDVTVPIAGDEFRLTLATCNSFGSTDDRYIVEAEQVEVRNL